MTASERLFTYSKRLLRFTLAMAGLVGVMAASLALIGPQLHDLFSAHRSDHERISLKPLAERSFIYDTSNSNPVVLTNSKDPQNRSRVLLDEIPETVKGSVVAVEDAAFREHNGINVRSILRAVDANLESGGVAQGGSTITQQVIKNSLVGDDQDLSRKLREAFLAIELEEQMSKDDILEYYLNSVYFGGGAYGVQAASEYYFGKDVGDLNWAEGALLASLIRSPNYYNPFRNPDVAESRRDLVFGRLVATDRMTPEQVEFWEQVPLPTESNPPAIPYDYFVEEVKQRLLNDPKFGLGATEAARNRAVFESGIRVYTTSDPVMQFKALDARNETLPGNRGDATFDAGVSESGEELFGTAAIASIEPQSGAVRTMVGGPDFERFQYNLVTQSEQQPGSTFKTFVMASLFEQGYVPSDTVRTPGTCKFTFDDDDQEEYKGRGGTITKVTQKSSTCAYMELGQVAGIENVAELASKVGVNKSQLYLTDKGNPTAPPNNLPLGTQPVTPLEVASAYATFANDGFYNEPYYVERIEDRDGNVLYQHEAKPVPVIEPQTARLVTEVLTANVTGGTGQRAQIPNGQVAAGKTGTTNESADVWFAGYTPKLATAIWIGAVQENVSLDRVDPELRGATGGRFAAAMWGRYYDLLSQGEPNVDFDPPLPTRPGKSVGKIPNLESSRSRSSGSGSTPRRAPRRTPRGDSPTPAPRFTPPPTAPPVTPAPEPAPPANFDPIPEGGG